MKDKLYSMEDRMASSNEIRTGTPIEANKNGKEIIFIVTFQN